MVKKFSHLVVLKILQFLSKLRYLNERWSIRVHSIDLSITLLNKTYFWLATNLANDDCRHNRLATGRRDEVERGGERGLPRLQDTGLAGPALLQTSQTG